MRARLLRPSLALAVTATAVLALSGSAAVKPLVLTDISGDANGLNDQGSGAGFDNNAAPVSEAGADIVKGTLANTVVGKRCTGFTLTMEFAGDVDPSFPAIYRLLGNTTKNDGIFQIYLNNGLLAGGESEIRHGAGEADDTFAMRKPAKVAGKTITFTVTDKDMKAFGDKPGNKILSPVLEVRMSSGVSFVPVVDQLDASDKSFVMCG